MSTTKLLNAVIATGAGLGVGLPSKDFTIQSFVVGQGTVSATYAIETSNNAGADWDPLATITITKTTRASGSFSALGKYDLIRCNLTAISGTNASFSSILSF